jgi:UDP-glucose 4-epimerase
MKCIVTGAAGFIGSHLCRRLLQGGFSVTGIDCLSDYYPRWIKEKNIGPLLGNKRFRFLAEDILSLDLKTIFIRADVLFHLAAQAGVRSSWGESFAVYVRDNIQATQKILEEAKSHSLRKIIFASSSSVYGLCPELPMREASPLLPLSPYGVTKLAGEHLCFLYHKNYGLPAVSLRFFTVYGPGQRPDMAFHKFFKAIAEKKEIPVYGDGCQTRDFTFIEDVIEAVVSSLENGRAGESYNIGGGHRKTLQDLFPLFEEICRKKIKVQYLDKQKGDVPDTWASIAKAREELHYSPRTPLREGLREQWKWICNLYGL